MLLVSALAGCSSGNTAEPDKFRHSITACTLFKDATLAELARPYSLTSSDRHTPRSSEYEETTECVRSFEGKELSHHFEISVHRFLGGGGMSGAERALEREPGTGANHLGWIQVRTDTHGGRRLYGRDSNVVAVISHKVTVHVSMDVPQPVTPPTGAQLTENVRLLAKEAHDALIAQIDEG